MEQEKILQTMHDFLDYVEGLQRENSRLKLELACAEKRLAKLNSEPQEQQQDCRWIAVEDEQPMDGEQVVVMTATGARYVQTYMEGFTSKVAYWLRLPENI